MSSLPDFKEELRSSKYKVWHGKVEEVIEKLKELNEILVSKNYQEKKLSKIEFIISYLSNNTNKLTPVRPKY